MYYAISFSISFLLITSWFTGHGQNNTFVRQYIDQYTQLEEVHPDDNGCTLFSRLDSQLLMIRTSLSGDFAWASSFSYGSKEIAVYSAARTWDGGIVVAASWDEPPLYRESTVFKLDSMGTIVWANKLDFFGPCTTEVSRIIQTQDKGFVVVGMRDSIPSQHQPFIIKLDSAGSFVWARIHPAGGAKYYFDHVREENDDLYVSGRVSYSPQLFTMLLDSAGNTIRMDCFYGFYNVAGAPYKFRNGFIVPVTNTYQGTHSELIEFDTLSYTVNVWRINFPAVAFLEDAVRDSSGNFFIAGYSPNPNYGSVDRPYLVKLDSTLGFVWARVHGIITGSSSDVSWFTKSVAIAPGGGVVIGGNHFIKTDTSGSSGCFNAPSSISLTSSSTTLPPYSPYNLDTFVLICTPAVIVGSPVQVTNTLHCLDAVEEHVSAPVISVFPNPCNGNFIIRHEGTVDYFAEVVDVLGRVVASAALNTGRSVEFSLASSGVYFVRLYDKSTLIAVENIIVE